jgi:hypothetical protein
MAEQIQLVDLNAPRAIRAEKSRINPVVWVRHLWLLRELKDGDEQVIRKMELKPGLNILWAESADKDRKPELYDNSVSGHAAGKTTFSRLLRYVLGEGNFGNDALRDAVREKFKNNGWAVAEVHIRGTPWVVGRPLGVGARSFGIPDRTIQRLFEDHARPDIDDYLKALEDAVMAEVMVKRFASSGETIGWQHVLPWLARDQECRYRDLVEWRDPLSQSQSPAVIAADRQYLMRAMLSLVSEQEQKELELNAKLLAQNKADEALLPRLQHQARVDLERLKVALGKELPDLGDDLFHQAVNAELDARSRALDERAKDIPSPQEIQRLQEVWLRAASDADAAKQTLEEVRESLANHKQRLALLRNEITPQQYTEWLKSLPPAKGYCSVPLDIAREAGCTLAFERATDLQSEAELAKTKDLAVAVNSLVNSLSSEVANKAALANRRQEAAREPRHKLMEAQARQLNGTRELTKARDQVDELRRLAANAKKAWEDSQDLAKKIKLTETEIEDSRKRQEKIRQQHMAALGKFSDAYSQVIRAVMGKSLSAGVEFSGRSIALNLDYHGKLTSAAIESIKIIAFDLAAMLSSVEGAGFHPRLLVHDGPREADMSVEIYQKFFLFVRSMEAAFGENGPVNFQYIITTTEPPPTDLRRSPWLLETLNASEPERRLLRVDL